MDKIVISDLKIMALIGTLPEERTKKQLLILNVELYGDFRETGLSDNFSTTFDYSKIEQEIVDLVSSSNFQLLEALAEHLTMECLAKNVFLKGMRVRIDKPGAPRHAKCISIEIERFSPDK